jgi:hypothetical protein
VSKPSSRPSFGALLVIASVAATHAARATEPELRASLGEARYRTEERLPDGRLFNAESGKLHRGAAGLTLPLEAWRIDIDIEQARSTLAYQGLTQVGVPLATTTQWRQDSIGMQGRRLWNLGRPQADGSGAGTWQAEAQLGLRSRSALRAIQPTAFTTLLQEQLDSTEWLAGAALHVRSVIAGQRWGARAEWRVARPLAQRLAVEAPGSFERVALHPAARSGQRKSLQLAWYSGSAWSLHWTWNTETLRPGASQAVFAFRNGFPVGQITFPGSEQRLAGHTLGLSWAR